MFKKRNKDELLEYKRLMFEMFYEHVYQTSYFIVKDPYLAQDVTQDTFIKAFDQVHSLHDGKKMKSWIGTIATRTAIDYIRKSKKRIDIPTEDVYIDEKLNNKQGQTPVEELVAGKLVKQAIKKNIKELEPPEYREVIVLKYLYELRDEEIASLLGVSVGAVKSRIHRARKKLRTVLRNDDEIRNGDVL